MEPLKLDPLYFLVDKRTGEPFTNKSWMSSTTSIRFYDTEAQAKNAAVGVKARRKIECEVHCSHLLPPHKVS